MPWRVDLLGVGLARNIHFALKVPRHFLIIGCYQDSVRPGGITSRGIWQWEMIELNTLIDYFGIPSNNRSDGTHMAFFPFLCGGEG
jgi:hypothetical protein